jgi:hypothetical protein
VNELLHFLDGVFCKSIGLMVVGAGKNVFDVHPLAPFFVLIRLELGSSVGKDFLGDAKRSKLFSQRLDDVSRRR